MNDAKKRMGRLVKARYGYARRRWPTVREHTMDETGIRYELELAFHAGVVWADRNRGRKS